MKGQDLHDWLYDSRTPWHTDVKTVDEDGFVRDVVGVEIDEETGVLLLRLEIQKKNGEIE